MSGTGLVIRVRCPTCRAKKGEPCRRPTGVVPSRPRHYTRWYHPKRVDRSGVPQAGVPR